MKNDAVVRKIIEHADKILQYCKGADYETFADNSLLVEACVFNLSQMGELANRVDEEFQKLHTEVPWRYIYALRNRIVHDYEGVNLRLIWEIISEDLEPLKEALKMVK